MTTKLTSTSTSISFPSTTARLELSTFYLPKTSLLGLLVNHWDELKIHSSSLRRPKKDSIPSSSCATMVLSCKSDPALCFPSMIRPDFRSLHSEGCEHVQILQDFISRHSTVPSFRPAMKLLSLLCTNCGYNQHHTMCNATSNFLVSCHTIMFLLSHFQLRLTPIMYLRNKAIYSCLNPRVIRHL